MKAIVTAGVVLAALAASAQAARTTGGREAFLLQQTSAEVQRISAQMDAMQEGLEGLGTRVVKLERGAAAPAQGGGDVASLRAEVAALKADLASLRRLVEGMRSEIVRDLSSRLVQIQRAQTPPPPPPPQRRTVEERVEEYTVQSGDSLSLIAEAFDTTPAKLRELNKLKSDRLRLGQRLVVPKAAPAPAPTRRSGSSRKGKRK